MEFLGVGPTELLLIIIVALIVLGPKDLAKTGRTVGKWLNNIVQSDIWKTVKKTSQELRQLPTQLMRDENLEKYKTELNAMTTAPASGTWSGRIGSGVVSPPRADAGPAAADKNTIQPPAAVTASPAKTSKPAPASSSKGKKPATSMKPPAGKTSRTPRKKKNA